jgi:hypothetical protein
MSLGSLQPRLERVQSLALAGGSAGLVVSLAGIGIWPRIFFPPYLVALLFWVGLALGCASITMLHHLVGGMWALPIRRPLEAGALCLVPMAVLFLPIVFGLSVLYPWAQSSFVAHHPELSHKFAHYLNPGAFTLRAVADFALWIVLALLLNRWSIQQDRALDDGPTRRLQNLSGPGLGILFLTGTFAVIDWGMSLEPAWYSTIYGAMVIVGWGLETFAFMIAVAVLLSKYEPIASVATPEVLNDLGNLMLAFVMLWAYMAFSQFLIVWAGNLVEEIPWYLRRTRGGWEWVALALVLFHFFGPFLFLLFRDNKRRARYLLVMAAAVVLMHLLDLSWLVLPAPGDPIRPTIPWASLALVPVTTFGLGGIWVWTFVWALLGKPLVPRHDLTINPALELSHRG